MADGVSRFTPGGQYYYQNQHSRTLTHRNGSPPSSSRNLFPRTAETPSPNRSPGAHSPARHNPFTMYNHTNHRQNQALQLNSSSSHQNYQAQLNLHKGFQPQNHNHHSHHMNGQHQEHTALGGGHGNNFGGHQHTISTSTLSNNTPHFTPAHLQNGTPEHSVAASKPPNEHWAEQIREHQKLKLADKPHFYARTAPLVSRLPGHSTTILNARADAEEHGERRRMTATTEEQEETGSWDAMDLGGHGLRSMGASIFRCYPHLRKIYFNHNKLNWLPIEIGQMRSLTVLDLSFNQLEILPPEIGMLTNLKRLLLYENALVDLPSEMGSLYQLEMLGIEGNPLLPELKERIVEHGTRELIRFLREQAEPPRAPNEREVVTLLDATETDADRFTVLSWNTLCDRAATQAAYGYTPSEVLSWQRRKSVVLDELIRRNADILTLQEVDIENYNEYFRPNLAAEDYKGVFWPKSRAQTMGEKEAKVVDGCATFYKNSKYILLDKQCVVFSREAINRPDMKGEHDVYNRVMPRDHIAVIVFLENRQTGSRLIVVNTHLTWEGWFADVKIIQVAILMEHLAKLTQEYTKWAPCKDKEMYKYANEDGVTAPAIEPGPSMKYDDATHIPLLLCGDFNSMHDSGVYELITQGSLSNAHADLGTQKYGDFTRNGMSHPFSLKSAYANIGELPFTNYTPDFREVIDYIWYSTNALQVTQLLGEVDPDYMRRVPGFPNYHFPSDHLTLWAEFAVKGRKERKQVEADFGTATRRESRH